MKNSPRRVTRVLRVLEGVLLVIGLASIGWYTSVRMTASREQVSLSRELDRLATSGTAATAKAVHASRGLVGRIEVPRLQLSAVAREGVDVGTLRRAVGHIPGTALPGERGNAGFAAHRDTFFGPLKSVRKGDEVIVTTPRGVYRYAVTGTRIVEPEDVSVLDPTSEKILTLVTCYPFDYIGSAPQRFIVRAALQK
jgi:sortase A